MVVMIAGCSGMNLETILKKKVLGQNCGSGARCGTWSQLLPFCRVLEVVVQIDFSSIGVLSVAGEEQRSQSQSLLLT